MKKSVWIITLIVVVVFFVYAGVRQIQRSRRPLPKSITELQQAQGVPVEVATAHTDTFRLSRSFMGTVKGGQQGDVMAPIMEKIVSMPVQVGESVKRGQVVARLDSKAPSAQYSQAKLAYEDAEREARRLENLFNVGAVSEQMVQKAQLARDIAKQNYESSSELVALTSPLDGVVTDLFYRVGETTKMGEPVIRIADLKNIKVEFKVNYDDRRLITEQTPVFLRLGGNGVTEIPAHLTDIGLSADPESRLFNIWVTAENLAKLLQPGLLVDVRLIVLEKPGTVLIPREALLTRRDQRGVFAVDQDQKAIFTPLQIGGESAAEIEVLGGLVPGQKVVVQGQNRLQGGELVHIVNL